MATISGGEKLQKALAGMSRSLGNASVVNVGFLAGATYPGGKPVAMIAAIQNWGAPRAGVPARPFFTNMVRAKKAEWPKAIAGLLKSTNYDALRTLQLTGEAIAGQLRTSIIETNAPALKPATIARKGHAKPLVASGLLLGSVEYEVKA